MTKLRKYMIFCTMCFFFTTNCDHNGVVKKSNDSSKGGKASLCVSDSEIYKDIMIDGLCERIIQLQNVPIKKSVSNDDIYNGIIAMDKDMIPCLVNKITDTRTMENPFEAPFHGNKTLVGDVALDLLVQIVEINRRQYDSIFSPEISSKMKAVDNAIYIEFMQSSPEKRIELQKNIKKVLNDLDIEKRYIP